MIPNWSLQSEIPAASPHTTRICPAWMASLSVFLAAGKAGTIRCLLLDTPNDQCATNEQLNVVFKPSDSVNYLQLPEIEWSLHRELAKLRGGGITLDPESNPRQATLFLPLYA